MTKGWVLAGAVVVASLAWHGPAAADHMKQVGPSGALLAPDASESRDTDSTLDIDLKLGKDTFRLGGRVFGSHGVAGAWLNGQRRPNGFAIDGRVQHEGGRAYNFTINADVLDLLTRSPWGLLLRRPPSSAPSPDPAEKP